MIELALNILALWVIIIGGFWAVLVGIGVLLIILCVGVLVVQLVLAVVYGIFGASKSNQNEPTLV